jgi:hypothetical protein
MWWVFSMQKGLSGRKKIMYRMKRIDESGGVNVMGNV